jgi:hypothetical protein
VFGVLGLALVGCGQPADPGDPADPGAGHADESSQDPNQAHVLIKNWNLGWMWQAAKLGGTLLPSGSIETDGKLFDSGHASDTLTLVDGGRFVRYSLPDLSKYDLIGFDISSKYPSSGYAGMTVACLVGDGQHGAMGSCAVGNFDDGVVWLNVGKAYNQGWWNQAQNLIVTSQANWDHSQKADAPADSEDLDFTIGFNYGYPSADNSTP